MRNAQRFHRQWSIHARLETLRSRRILIRPKITAFSSEVYLEQSVPSGNPLELLRLRRVVVRIGITLTLPLIEFVARDRTSWFVSSHHYFHCEIRICSSRIYVEPAHAASVQRSPCSRSSDSRLRIWAEASTTLQKANGVSCSLFQTRSPARVVAVQRQVHHEINVKFSMVGGRRIVRTRQLGTNACDRKTSIASLIPERMSASADCTALFLERPFVRSHLTVLVARGTDGTPVLC